MHSNVNWEIFLKMTFNFIARFLVELLMYDATELSYHTPGCRSCDFFGDHTIQENWINSRVTPVATTWELIHDIIRYNNRTNYLSI